MDNTEEEVITITEDKSHKLKQYVINKLDNAEIMIENIRKEALKMSEDLDDVYNSVDALRNSKALLSLSDMDQEEMNQYADRIVSRCDTVQINVNTTRSESQQNCLEEINVMIDKIVKTIKDNPDGAKSTCQSYLASCSSMETDFGNTVFEKAVLGCTLDDQKRILRRLQGLSDYIAHATYNIELDSE